MRADGSFCGGSERTMPVRRNSRPWCLGLNLRSPRSLKRSSLAEMSVGLSSAAFVPPGSAFQMPCEKFR